MVWCALALPLAAVSKELETRADVHELPQAQDPDLVSYDDYNPFEDENGNTTRYIRTSSPITQYVAKLI